MVSVCASAPNLCFRGMCVDSPSPFLCECQPGWTSDLTIFWMNDCSMPDYWMDVLGGVTLGGSLAVFVYGLLLLREPRKGAVRKVLERVVAMQLFGAAAAVTVLVEQRVGPTFLLFMALSTSLMTWSGAIFIREFLRVATKSLQVTIPQQKLLTLLLRTFPLLGGGPFFLGAFGGYATQGDPAAYNLVICIMLFISPILQIVSAPILVISTTNLINLVKTVKSSRPKAASSGAVQKQEELMAQLVKFRALWGLGAPLTCQKPHRQHERVVHVLVHAHHPHARRRLLVPGLAALFLGHHLYLGHAEHPGRRELFRVHAPPQAQHLVQKRGRGGGERDQVWHGARHGAGVFQRPARQRAAQVSARRRLHDGA
jgi:hypothetical protein